MTASTAQAEAKSVYVTGRGRTVHPVNCPTVTRTMVGGGAVRMVYATRTTVTDMRRGLESGRYTACKACQRIEGSKAQAARDARDAVQPVAEPVQPTEAPAEPVPALPANTKGRDRFMAQLGQLADREQFEEIIERVLTEGAALGPRKAEWVAAVGWFSAHKDGIGSSDTYTARWVALQGMIGLTYGNL